MLRLARHRLRNRSFWSIFTLSAGLLAATASLAQNPPPPAPPPAASAPASSTSGSDSSQTPAPSAASETKQSGDANSAEVTTHDTAPTFKVRVNEVLVRVVVRGSDGKIIPNLKKEDFQLFDNKKPQTISSFRVETPDMKAVKPLDINPNSLDSAAPTGTPVPVLPQRF